MILGFISVTSQKVSAIALPSNLRSNKFGDSLTVSALSVAHQAEWQKSGAQWFHPQQLSDGVMGDGRWLVAREPFTVQLPRDTFRQHTKHATRRQIVLETGLPKLKVAVINRVITDSKHKITKISLEWFNCSQLYKASKLGCCSAVY
jgi:hypothetical protein